MKKKLKKNTQIQTTPEQLRRYQQMKYNQAFEVMRVIPLLVLRDHGFGQKRLRRYLEDFDDKTRAFNEGWFDLNDVREILIEETGLDLNKEGMFKGDFEKYRDVQHLDKEAEDE